MKKKSTSQSAFLNVRVLIGLCVFMAGVFLALVSFSTFSSAFAQNGTNPNQQAVQPANDGSGIDLSSSDPNLNPQLAPQPRVVHGNPQGDPRGPLKGGAPTSAWGPNQQGATWIAASQWAVRLSSTAPVLTYAGNHFYNSPDGLFHRYFAQLQVEPGVLISHLTCVYNDTDAVNDLTFQWQKYTTHLDTGTSSSVILDSFTTSGSSGVGFNFLTPAAAETMSTFDGSFALINHYISVDVAGAGTSFAGCWAFWNRQVAPGPATATFTDVPPTSPQFPYVEALVETGVTVGCAPGLYCPGDPVTRGQMAVFLAKALGMGFPY